MNNLMILATAAFAMLLATGCTVVLRRKRHREAQGGGGSEGVTRPGRSCSVNFWRLLSRMRTVMPTPADVKRAVARYHAALEDLPDGRESHQLGPGRKRVSHWF